MTLPRSSQPDYQRWLALNYPSAERLAEMGRIASGWQVQPIISVVMPVYDPPEPFLEAAIQSVRAQVYPRWELCIADDGSTNPRIQSMLAAAEKGDSRIRVARHEANRGIVAASNLAFQFASGDFVAFLDHDDELTPHALFEIARLIIGNSTVDMIYSDEDKSDENGVLSGPFFKPDWCPDSFLARMYTCHLSAYRRELVAQLGGFRPEFEGGQSYDLALRLSEVACGIHHISDVLYHWRQHAGSTALDATQKLYVYEADKRAVQAAVDRRGEPGRVERVPGELGSYVVRYQIRSAGKVSIIIPSRDHGHMLNTCVQSIFERSTYAEFEVVVVDNGTTEPHALEVIGDWTRREPSRFRTIALDIPFNFSSLCDAGARAAAGEFLLFLNNDTEVITPDWIEAMVEQAQRPSIGAVGALLLYEDGRVQHAGAILGLGGLAAHSHRGFPGTSPGYMGQIITTNNYLSVAGSCLMIRRQLFEDAGGFDEQLPGDYEDVDLCLKLVERGLRNVYLPHVQLYHYESITRGRDYVEKAPAERLYAINLIRSRWQRYIDHDPCYSPHLTRAAENYALNLPPVSARVSRPRQLGRQLLNESIDRAYERFPDMPRVDGLGWKVGCRRIARAVARRLFSSISPVDLRLADNPAYRSWLSRKYPKGRQLARLRRNVRRLSYRPLISVLLPVHDIEARYLREAIESVRSQTYPHWQLCVADDGSTAAHIRPMLERYAKLDRRIKVVFRGTSGNISAASNSALALATGEFVAQLDHDDRLAPHALQQVATLLNEQCDLDFIYSDEDKIDPHNIHRDPFFKPDWSPDTFLTKMYTCHLGVYRRSLLVELGGFRSAFDGAEDYDLVLRLVERTDRIAHIADVLYHWRMHHQSTATASRTVKTWAYQAAVRALQEAVDRRGEKARVSMLPGGIGMYEVRYAVCGRPRVSIIIPTRDLGHLLDRCLLSVFETTTYSDFEVLVVDNGSIEPNTECVLQRWREREPRRFRSYRNDYEFNFARLCNEGAAGATGAHLVFLNNDTNVISRDWLESMIEQAQRPSIGAVGGQLLYPDNSVQHAGIIVGIEEAAGHALRGAPADGRHYFGRLNTTSNVAAVSAACLMCRRDVFEMVGGFDESFPTAYNDVDLCLRMLDRGLRNVYLPHVKLYHLESQTWRLLPGEHRTRALESANRKLRERWRPYIDHDPFYSPHLSRVDEAFSLR